jgi:glycosyltransferase involved in cell wall biosynthesis
MIVAFVRALRGRRQTKIVLVGFILTQRRQPLHNWLRAVYFRWLFSLVQLVVVHSRTEAERYASLYRQSAARFVFIRWGSYVIKLPENELHLAPGRAGADVLAVGRSGRDYPTLFRALGGTELCVRVICDVPAALADCTPAPNIEIMDRCFGGDYLRELNNASCMVIPLGVADISAGQMVLLQAMEMGKAVVITRTATTLDYVADGQEALLVEPGDAEGLRRAVTQLVADPALRERLARQARDSFNRHFTVPAFVDALVTEIQKLDPAAGRPVPP